MGSAKIKLSHNAKAIVKQTCYQKLTKPITINLHRIVQYKNVDRLTDWLINYNENPWKYTNFKNIHKYHTQNSVWITSIHNKYLKKWYSSFYVVLIIR